MMDGLKPCPFCGGEALLLHENFGINKYSYIKCLGCGVETERFQISTDHSCDDKAVEAWNRRKDDGKQEARAEIVRCEECKHYIAHDKRCGYWNHGVFLDWWDEWCSHGERRGDG